VKEHVQVIAMEGLGSEEEEKGERIAPQFSADPIIPTHRSRLSRLLIFS
jgi:hypothetical protein